MISRFLQPAFILSVILLLPSCEEPALDEEPGGADFVTFMKTFGGSSPDVGYSVQQTADGGYIIAGSTSSFGAGATDVYLIKTHSNGYPAWTRTFGGIEPDMGCSVQQTADGGYIIVGDTHSYGAGVTDFWLIKTHTSGDTAWTRTFGGSEPENVSSILQTTDGGYIIAGNTYSYGSGYYDIWLIKTDASGDTAWTRTFGGSYNDGVSSMQQTADGGYIIAGSTESNPFPGVWLIKTDASGDVIWTRTVVGGGIDRGYFIQQTADGGYIIVGVTEPYIAGNQNIWLVKTNASGDTTWTRTFGGTDDDIGYSVQQTTDEGYIIAGSTRSFGAGGLDVWLIKTNATGDIVWTRTFGGSGSDIGRSVQQTADGGYIVVGSTSSYGAGGRDVWLIKTDENGNAE